MSMRRGRSDWPEFTRRQKQPTQGDLALMHAWQTPAERRTPAQSALVAGDATQRATPVQREAPEMERLWRAVRGRWWRPGWWRWEAAAWSEAEARRRAREGVRAAWPDCGLLIPPMYPYVPVTAYCEMKAPDRRPKRTVAEQWWLEPDQTGSRYGLTREQGAVLRMLAHMGASTMVAYSADEALAWFDALAGPRPEVLPECWRYWVEPEL